MAEVFLWILGVALLLALFVIYRFQVALKHFYGAVVALSGELVAQHDRLKRLVEASKPFTAKTSFTFTGGVHGRAEEVARNNDSENLRKVLHEITNDPQRPQNLDGEAKGIPIIMYPPPNQRVNRDE